MAAHIQKDKQAQKRYEDLCNRISQNTGVDPFESEVEKKDRIDILKKDFRKFVSFYFEHLITDDETGVRIESPDFHVRIANKTKRSIKYKGWLQWSRGHAKSVVATTLLPLWLWINKEINFLVVIGQNEDKAKILLSDIQAEFASNPRLINDFGSQKLAGNWEDGFFKTKSGFLAKAIGVGQDPRGLRSGKHRPDMLVADDWETKETSKNPKRQKEYANWFLRGCIPAMTPKRRRVLIAQNKFHPTMIFDLVTEGKKSWDIDRVDAFNPITYEPIWPEMFTPQFFRDQETDIGALEVAAEYNNTPHIEGKEFKDEYIHWVKLPRLDHFDQIVGRWDVAYGGTTTSDFNAVRIWGLKDGKKYLIDCFVQQSKVIKAVEWIAMFQQRLPKSVTIQIGFEAQFWNESILKTIKEVESKDKIKLNLIKIERRKGNKFDAIMSMLPDYQNGLVFYNRQLKGHNDTMTGLAQLKGIEPGYSTKDDAPDADKYAFDYLDRFTASKNTSSRVGQPREKRTY